MTYPPTDHGPEDVIDDYVSAADGHALEDTLADLEAWMRSERGDPAEALMLVYEAVLALEAETGGELGDGAPLGIVYQHVADEDPGWLRGLFGLGEKADWSREEGPNGGTRWVNADGDVRYREPADVDKEPESEAGRLAKDLEEGDRIVIDDEEGIVAEVENVKGMGGGQFVAMRDDQDEVHTERVGPNHEFEVEADDPGGDSDESTDTPSAEEMLEDIRNGSERDVPNPADGGMEPRDVEPDDDWPLHGDTEPDTMAWVPVDEVVSTQEEVDLGTVAHHMESIQDGVPATPPAFSLNDEGEPELQDGNHTAVASWLLGYDQVPMDGMGVSERYEMAPEGQTLLYEKPGGINEMDDEGPSDLSEMDGTEDPGEIADALDIDYSDRNEFRELRPEQQEKLREGLTEVYGEDAVDGLYDQIRSWKQGSSGAAGSWLESGFDGALDLPGEAFRSNGIHEPTEEQQRAMGVLSEVSSDFVREEYGDEVEMHRGVSSEAWEEYQASDDEDLEMSSMAVGTTGKGIAESFAFGEDSATVSWTVDADDVVFAMDALSEAEHEGGREAEFQVKGGAVTPGEVDEA